MARFQWDQNKNQKNKVKHGVSFQEATAVFDDESLVTKQDTRHDYGEERYNSTGWIGRLLSVIWTPRNGQKRLISARGANSKEKRRYNDTNNTNY